MNKNIYSEAKKRTVDTKTYLSVLRELVLGGKEVNLIVSGNSMFPFLEHERDTVYFESPSRDPRKGDIVFYQRQSGQFVMHRVCYAKDNNYYLIGDAQSVIEGPVEREQIFAIITHVQRNGKLLDPSSFTWKFFEKAWINVIPYRHFLMLPWRFVRKIRKLTQKA